MNRKKEGESMSDALAMLDTMEQLRRDGWWITLRAVPEPRESHELPWLGWASKGGSHTHYVGADTPEEAVRLVAEKVRGGKQ